MSLIKDSRDISLLSTRDLFFSFPKNVPSDVLDLKRSSKSAVPSAGVGDRPVHALSLELMQEFTVK